MFRIDHNFTPNFRANHSFYWNRRPSVRNCEGPDGCNYDANPETESAQNTDYYGNGFFQRISTHHAHQQFDWIIKHQPAEPLHDRLGSLVHGRQSPLGGRELAAAAVGRDRRSDRRPGHDRRGTPDDAVRRRHRPVHAHRPRRLAAVRLREERSLAVLERPHLGEGAPHAEDRLRVPPSQLPVARLGAGSRRPATSRSIVSAPPGSTPPATTSRRRATRLPRSSWGRFTTPIRTSTSSRPSGRPIPGSG